MTKRSFVAAAALTSILAGSAMAADMPTKVYRSPPAEVFSWSGLYVGGHLGYGWSSNEVRFDLPSGPNVVGANFPLGSGTINGALGGVQAGFNWQTGAMVLGVEADFSWADMSGETCNHNLAEQTICSTKVERFGTITGRIGGAFDHTLLYLKAGGAWARDTQTLTLAATDEKTASKSKWGWTAGAGVEHAITRNWSAKLEYDFLLFGTERYAYVFNFPTNLDIRQRIHTVKLGFNYRFDWGGSIGASY
jgi:outer membrane immunogenic protein